MTAHALVTVGTDEVWAPPKLIALGLHADLTVRNLDAVSWEIVADGWITRGAIQINGEWCRLDLTEIALVHRGQEATFASGSLRIDINLPSIDMRPAPSALPPPRRELGMPRRELGMSHSEVSMR